tara:strand:+ start:340 stop:465 length:126 start_codon:yes stop_codon:yes gene_type:complete
MKSSDTPNGCKEGEYMHEWFDADAVLFDMKQLEKYEGYDLR